MRTVLAPDPALPLPDHALRALAAALSTEGPPLRVPAVPGLDGAVLVRWLYRRWLDALGEWRPLVQVAGPLGPWIEDARALAAGGWLHLDEVAAPPASGRVVVVDRAARIELEPALVQRFLHLDQDHLVATDPALGGLRRSLDAYARTGALVVLRGPPGAGKRALARYAASSLGDRPLLDGAREVAGQGSPALFAHPGSMTEDARERLRQRALRPSVQRPFAAGPATPRPAHLAFQRILGVSPALCRVLADATRVARAALPVLLLGEPGTGKELFARAIHEASGRKGPFEAVDLSAIPRELVESELFGHAKGAFTGAVADRPGAFRRAEGGTLFLDELGNLEPAVQVKLLRVLQEREVRPVGGARAISVDVRVVSATNADLDAMVGRGAFRMDLLHRLNAATLRLPPLRERPEDVAVLARAFLREARGPGGTDEIAPEAMSLLQAWAWPGNVRELWGTLQRAAAFSEPALPLPADSLGPIATETCRGPTFVTAGPDEEVPDLPGSVHLDVPALGLRGRESVRHALLTLAAGRPLAVDAVELLEGLPWEGGLWSLGAELSALRAVVRGPIVRAAVLHVLPHLAPRSGEMIFLLAPGTGAGFERAFEEAAVVVGRARGLADLEAGGARGGARVSAVRALAGEDDLGFLAFPQEASLSRAQVLVRRLATGLEVHLLPDAAAPTFVRPVGSGSQRLAVGRPARVGEGAEIVLHLDREGVRQLRLGVFRSPEARERLGVFFEDSGEEAAFAETAREGRGGELGAAEPLAAAGRVWPLSVEERAALNRVVLSYTGGDFSAHLRAGLSEAARRGPETARLASYVLRVRPTQYCARLYEHESNRPLREELASELGRRPDAASFLASLPRQLAVVIGG